MLLFNANQILINNFKKIKKTIFKYLPKLLTFITKNRVKKFQFYFNKNYIK